jgi:hypothetical protein
MDVLGGVAVDQVERAEGVDVEEEMEVEGLK